MMAKEGTRDSDSRGEETLKPPSQEIQDAEGRNPKAVVRVSNKQVTCSW